MTHPDQALKVAIVRGMTTLLMFLFMGHMAVWMLTDVMPWMVASDPGSPTSEPMPSPFPAPSPSFVRALVEAGVLLAKVVGVVIVFLMAAKLLERAASHVRDAKHYSLNSYGEFKRVELADDSETIDECLNCGDEHVMGRARKLFVDTVRFGFVTESEHTGTTHECKKCERADSIEYQARSWGIADDQVEQDDDDDDQDGDRHFPELGPDKETVEKAEAIKEQREISQNSKRRHWAAPDDEDDDDGQDTSPRPGFTMHSYSGPYSGTDDQDQDQDDDFEGMTIDHAYTLVQPDHHHRARSIQDKIEAERKQRRVEMKREELQDMSGGKLDNDQAHEFAKMIVGRDDSERVEQYLKAAGYL